MKPRKPKSPERKRTEYQQRVAEGIERMAPKRDVFAELLGLPRRTAAGTGATGATGDIGQLIADTASDTGSGTGSGTGDTPPPTGFRSEQRSARSATPDQKIDFSLKDRCFDPAEAEIRSADQISTSTTDTGTGAGTGTGTITSTTSISYGISGTGQKLILRPERFTPREMAVLRIADRKASLDNGEFWCRSSEFMSLARLVNRNFFFDALKRLENRGILEVLVKYNGCREGVKYRLCRDTIPPDIWEHLAGRGPRPGPGPNRTGSSSTTSPTGSTDTGGMGDTGAGTGAAATAYDDHDLIDHEDYDHDQSPIPAVPVPSDDGLISINLEKKGEEHLVTRVEQMSGREVLASRGAPAEVVEEFVKLTGGRWQPKFDLLWQELINKAENARIGYTLAEVIQIMRRATQAAASRPKSFKYYTVSLEREWGLQKKLASAIWADILREAETNRQLSDYTSKLEVLKCKFAELGIAWDNDLIHDVTRRRA